MKDDRVNEPCFTISIVSKMVEMHPQTIRHYERMGLLEPQRSDGNIRLFSKRDVERLRRIQNFTRDMGVNLAGVEVILKLLEQIDDMRATMESEIHEMKARMERDFWAMKKNLEE
ncbi:MAG TPA: helix-turn-helix transcriptional regulator [Candidatus Eremiobacteraeota bacterium]|nr:MAG: putative heat shock protein HspR [bacterium ADurb.Bin363]HPZ07537.1 helix-turn-helix transcriptional regulator [Candidatus Eremiobacteraeota bacterium]